MKISIQGQRRYAYPAEEIYQLILDLPSIAMQFPVIKSVDTPRENQFVFTFAVDFSVYSGTYQATVFIVDQRRPEYLKLKGVHKSGVGRLNIDLEALISQRGDTNNLYITGTFDVGGMMSFAGRKTLTNGVNFGLKLMFDFLEDQLKSQSNPA